MNKKEWQEKHGIDDEDMARIEFVIKRFKGRVVSVDEKRPEANLS